MMKPPRLLYIDNLRWVMIMLVVSMHAAVTYSHLGSWYYMENAAVSPAETGIFATYQVSLQSFFMGFLFFIAGYFVPGAYDSKGPGRFLRDRVVRLGLPLLFYMFILQPVSVYCISLFHGENVYPEGFLAGYRYYITAGLWVGGSGPLWFCEALLLFCLAYVLVRLLGGGKARLGMPGRAGVWGLIVLITLLTFATRFPWPKGTAFYNLQFCYFPQYILFFTVGTLAFRNDWLRRFSNKDKKYWGWLALAGGLLGWAALLVFGGAFRGAVDTYNGGLHWQSLAMSLWEAAMGVALSIFFLVWFRENFDSQGPAARYYSANAFAVYVFHAPVLIALSRLISPLRGPLLAKFLFLTVVSILATYALSSVLLRRVPLLKRIL